MSIPMGDANVEAVGVTANDSSKVDLSGDREKESTLEKGKNPGEVSILGLVVVGKG